MIQQEGKHHESATQTLNRVRATLANGSNGKEKTQGKNGPKGQVGEPGGGEAEALA